jgi:hypothetical protein
LGDSHHPYKLAGIIGHLLAKVVAAREEQSIAN